MWLNVLIHLLNKSEASDTSSAWRRWKALSVVVTDGIWNRIWYMRAILKPFSSNKKTSVVVRSGWVLVWPLWYLVVSGWEVCSRVISTSAYLQPEQRSHQPTETPKSLRVCSVYRMRRQQATCRWPKLTAVKRAMTTTIRLQLLQWKRYLMCFCKTQQQCSTRRPL